jgi:Ca2+-binding RTX toxin-like protein
MAGTSGNDRLEGGSGNDLLDGLAGNDVLIGRAGADRTDGGTGNDIHYVDSASDIVVERSREGDDTVFTSVSYALAAAAAVEALRATDVASTLAISLTGNEFNQSIYGNAGANVLRGGGGNDLLVGLAGNDTLDGGTGADNLRGGTGNDVYRIDNALDAVFENGGEGEDTVYAAVGYTLTGGAAVENLRASDAASTAAISLTGNEFNQSIYGNAGANLMRGGGGNDLLVGLAGNDTLDGGTGADNLRGGTGNDVYRVDNALDAIFENGGEGDDTVYAAVGYTLTGAAAVENLRASDAASTLAISLTGNEFNQSIYGNAGANVLRGGGGNDLLVGLAGNDTLVGGTGADNLRGGAGNDVYRIDSSADAALEASGEGDDLVLSAVSHTLAANIERASASDESSTAALNLTGNALGNALRSNAGANLIDGKGGNDTLIGLGGADTYAFTTGLGAGNVDIIAGFELGTDKILLGGFAGQPFASLASGALAPGAFLIGTAATTAAHIVYNSANGALLYDADASGAGAAVQLATLSPGLSLTASSFIVSGPANSLPSIASGPTATVAENKAVSTVVYQVLASDADGDRIAYRLGGADAAKLTIDASGGVRLRSPADYEAQSSYVFTVHAADSSGGGGEKTITLSVTDIAETLPPYQLSDQEPNGSPGEAQALDRARLAVTSGNGNLADKSLPSATIEGDIAAGGDRDFYSIHLDAGELLLLDVDGTDTLDSELRVFTFGGSEIALNDDPGAFDAGSTAHAGLSHNMDPFIRLRAPSDGVYVFSVRSFAEQSGSTTSGKYTLNVSVGPQATRAQIDGENIEAMLSGSSWSTAGLSYGFTSGGSDYGGSDASAEIEAGMAPLNGTQQATVRTVLGQIANVTNLALVQATTSPGSAELRYALSADPDTAHAYEPGPGDGGDSWYNSSGYTNPVLGNYEWVTFIHETGHALGLKHGHETPALSPDRDSMEYSVMTYRSYAGAPVNDDSGYTNETWGFAQTLMMYDIAALQRLYGADFTYNSGNTVYSWSPTTGAFMVNGVVQWTPGANRVFMTLWDGGGSDTYDLSNYSSGSYGLEIDLRPGFWSKLYPQIVNLGDGKMAAGSVANALLYDGDPRSLIENAIGTSMTDWLVGNDAQNRLTGGGGEDTFSFFTAAQSSPDAPDTIVDFESRTDKIDLTPFDTNPATSWDDSFSFIGSAEFSGRPQVRLTEENGMTHVFADVDGDMVADLHIIVNAINLNDIDIMY